MTLDYLFPGVLRINMTRCVKSLLRKFPEKIDRIGKCPWTENLFVMNNTVKRLDKEQAKMKGVFLSKQG
jgi:hypothetical protein